MPLKKSASKKAFGVNVSAEMHSGKSQKQAVAIAYSVQRKARHQDHGFYGHLNPASMTRGLSKTKIHTTGGLYGHR